jgi:hypothetical protein
MAFDKFKKCPLDDQLMDTLYNLGLDFERKRQFNKAQSVFELMSTHNPKFRDLEYRTSRAKAMSETAILGNGDDGRGNAGMLVPDGGTVEEPMLGHYQVEKELGNGAMGVVYLGKDPKIGINPVALNSALPDLVGIINRALAKQTQERFATGDQTAKAIRECAEVFGMVDVAL